MTDFKNAPDSDIVLHAKANGKAWLSTLPEDKALELATAALSQAADTGPKVLNDTVAEHEAILERR